MCVSGCPYKKVYFNHRTGKAEKCTFCFPRIEVGLPTVCSETCVGRLRYIGLVLYDADRVLEAAATPDDQDLYEAQRSILLDPHDPEVVRAAERDGIPHDWIEAAQRSPIHALINTYRVALPLHPEYRTMPMVWYIPPLSPVIDVVKETGEDAEDSGNLFAAIDALRIPIEYLAELFTAGDVAPVDAVLKKLAAMRSYMRDINLGREPDGSIPDRVGMSEEDMYDMYRLLALAKYDERYVIPPAHAEQAHSLEELATECSLDYEGGPGMVASGPFGEGSGAPTPIAVENFTMLKNRQTSDTMACTRGQGIPGQPAQLGREGHPGGSVPAPGRGIAGASRGGGAAVSAKHPRPAWAPDQLTATWQSASLLLGYPDERLRACLPVVRDAAARLPERLGSPLLDVVDHLVRSELEELQEAYVETFDTRRRCNLFLTYFAPRRHPQARRGAAAVQADLPALGVRPRRRRSCPTTSASCSSTPPRSTSSWDGGCCWTTGRAWSCCGWPCTSRRARGRALSRPSPRRFPPLRGDERDAVRALAAEGPPAEEVGLTPYGTPAFDPALADATVDLPMPRVRGGVMDQFLWVVLPYLCLATFVVGHFWRYRYDKFGWTTRSIAALRGPAAEAGLPAVPLRHARGRRRPRHRPAGAGVVDRRARDQHRDLPRRCGRGRSRSPG